MSHPTKSLFWGLASVCGFLSLIGYGNIALALVLIFGWLVIQYVVFAGFFSLMKDWFE